MGCHQAGCKYCLSILKSEAMKRVITLYMAILFAATVSAQQLFYAEDGQIRNLKVERANGEVTVTMDIDVTNISIGRDETIILTPIVTKGEQKVTMPSVELMGRRAYLYYTRDGENSVTENPFTTQRITKRAEKRDGAEQIISYKANFKFEEWMRGSSVALGEGLCGCGKPIATPRVNEVGDFGHMVYAPEYVWSFVAPEPEPVKVRNESHTAYINFWVNRYEILDYYKNNAKELAGIIRSISSVSNDEDVSITSITIEGWASPEDTFTHNKTLSQNRANSLANYISKRTGIERQRIKTFGCGEDWNGLRKLVDAEPEMHYRDKVYEVLDSELTEDQKDWRLKNLKPATIYEHLLRDLYPKLRRNDYKIVYEVRNFDIEEARVLIDKNPKKLSVDEIYKVAGSYEQGSKEYEHALAVAANEYPEVVAAAVNAANIAMAEGDYDKALEILNRSDKEDARIQAAKGYIYLMMKDYDKARELLTKAANKGNADAERNLAEMEKHLGSI